MKHMQAVATLALLFAAGLACENDDTPPEQCSVIWSDARESPRIEVAEWPADAEWSPADDVACSGHACTFTCGDATDVRVAWGGCYPAYVEAGDTIYVAPDCRDDTPMECFRCLSIYTDAVECIDAAWVCDGEQDCDKGEDETPEVCT